MHTSPADETSIVDALRNWLRNMVVGQNLCPFAQRVVNDDSVRFAVCQSLEAGEQLAFIADECQLLQAADSEQLATSLLIFPRGLNDFDHFLERLDQAEQLLTAQGLVGVLQLASFHPDYLFAGEAPNDLSHFSNRAPYPVLHLLREAQITQALQHYANPEQIPADNIRRLRQMSRQQLVALCSGVDPRVQ